MERLSTGVRRDEPINKEFNIRVRSPCLPLFEILAFDHWPIVILNAGGIADIYTSVPQGGIWQVSLVLVITPDIAGVIGLIRSRGKYGRKGTPSRAEVIVFSKCYSTAKYHMSNG